MTTFKKTFLLLVVKLRPLARKRGTGYRIAAASVK